MGFSSVWTGKESERRGKHRMGADEMDLVEAMDVLEVPQQALGRWYSRENSNRGALTASYISSAGKSRNSSIDRSRNYRHRAISSECRPHPFFLSPGNPGAPSSACHRMTSYKARASRAMTRPLRAAKTNVTSNSGLADANRGRGATSANRTLGRPPRCFFTHTREIEICVLYPQNFPETPCFSTPERRDERG